MVSFGISAIESDEENNKIYVYLDSLTDTNINKIKSYINCPAIEFKQQINKITSTTGLSNGITCSSAGQKFTLGFGAQKSDGTIGYVVPGHILASTGYDVYLGSSSNGTSIGTVSDKVCGGNCDASFVAQSGDTYEPSNTLGALANNSYSGTVAIMYQYPQNTALTAWGGVSGQQSGRILSNNFSFTSTSGVAMTGMVKSSYKAIGGDSGAPVCITSSSNYLLAGMQSASNLSSGYWTSDSYSVFSKVYNILSNLNCSINP